jgi:hypothetical protein
VEGTEKKRRKGRGGDGDEMSGKKKRGELSRTWADGEV